MPIWGDFMYQKNNKEQLKIEDFFLPFGGKLAANNRWVRLEKITPWDRIEEYYLQSMSQETGRGAISARVRAEKPGQPVSTCERRELCTHL